MASPANPILPLKSLGNLPIVNASSSTISDATPTPIKDAYVAVIGVSGAGKSSFISTCAGKQRPQPCKLTTIYCCPAIHKLIGNRQHCWDGGLPLHVQ
jgi:ABC-type Mn2+/Zn2+ transport system ATPase subunit